MKDHQFIILLLFVLVYVCGSTNFEKYNHHDHPNVLLIVVDDLRPVLSSYGDSFAVTPNMDKIASNGVLFNNAFAQQALCGPSRTSLLTSRRPDTIRLVDTHHYWRRYAGNFTTLPQYFKDNNYITQSVGKVFHPGTASNDNDDQPFSWSDTPYHPSSQKFKNAAVCPNIDGELHSNIYCPIEVSKQPEKTLPDIQSTEFALRWLNQKAKKERISCNHLKNKENRENCHDFKKPFFLAVGFHKPHIPLKFPKQFLDLYPVDEIPLPPNRKLPSGLPSVAWNPWNDLRRRDDISALNVSFPFGPIPDSYSKLIRQAYYAATSYTDSLIGLIVTLVGRLFPNTIIALIGDHGWSLGEHQEWSKFSNFDVATRVPLIICLPRSERATCEVERVTLREAGRGRVTSNYFKRYIADSRTWMQDGKKKHKNRKYNGVVELLDLFPTLVDLAGIPKLPSCPSSSQDVTVCTEGMSLSCIVLNNLKDRMPSGLEPRSLKDCPYKKVALSQYPRPSTYPSRNPDSDQPTLKETTIMGYSLRSRRYRFTVWLKFNHSTFKGDFNQIIAEELYDHVYDDEENNNIVLRQGKRAAKFKRRLNDLISSI